MEFSECFKFVSEEVVKALPEEGMWVPFSDDIEFHILWPK